MDLKERGWDIVEWINSVQNRDQWRNIEGTEVKIQVTY